MQYPEVFFKAFGRPAIYALTFLGLSLFLRGHNAPGGGFIAGLLIASAGLLSRMVLAEPLLNVRPIRLVPVGLLIAMTTGAVPLLFGESFLKSAHGHAQNWLTGEIEWATAVFFDTGVFLVVVGVTLTIIDLLSDDKNIPLQVHPTEEEQDREMPLLAGFADEVR